MGRMAHSLDQLLAIAGTLALFTLVPAVTGLIAGRQWTQVLGPLRSRWWLPLMLLVLPLTPVLIPVGTIRIGFWDMVWSAWFLGAGFVFTGHRSCKECGAQEIKLAVASLGVGMLILEGGARLLLAPPPFAFQDAGQVRMLRTSGLDDLVAEESLRVGVFPDADPDDYSDRVTGAPGATRRVLHVGDSMVHGFGVGLDKTFVALLNQRQDGTSHVNAGFEATGLDYYYLVATEWTDRLPYDAVNVYLFLGNDLEDMGRLYHFCNDRALLTYSNDELGRNCLEPGVATFSWSRLFGSPAPYLLRGLASFSAAARHLSMAPYRMGELLTWADPGDQFNRAYLVLAALQKQMAARKIPLQVVLLPVRRHWAEPGGRADGLHREILAQCRALGISVLDTWPAFEEAVQRDGPLRYFLNTVPLDPHLNEAGHAFLASLLDP